MNKNITYNLNETRLRATLEQNEVSFDEQHWLDAEKNLNALGLQRKANVTVNTKKIGIFTVLVVLAGGLVAFINYNKNKNSSAAFAEVKTENNMLVAGLNESAGIKVTNELPKLILNRKAVGVQPAVLANEGDVKQKEIVVAENKIEEKKIVDVVKEEKKQESNPVVTVDTSKKDVITVDNHESKKKKKKRKKRHSEDDAITPNTHSAGEDDVIISE